MLKYGSVIWYNNYYHFVSRFWRKQNSKPHFYFSYLWPKLNIITHVFIHCWRKRMFNFLAFWIRNVENIDDRRPNNTYARTAAAVAQAISNHRQEQYIIFKPAVMNYNFLVTLNIILDYIFQRWHQRYPCPREFAPLQYAYNIIRYTPIKNVRPFVPTRVFKISKTPL